MLIGTDGGKLSLPPSARSMLGVVPAARAGLVQCRFGVDVQGFEWFAELGAIDVAFASDPDLGEERLVELAAGCGAGSDVGGVAVPGEFDRPGNGCFYVVEVGGGHGEEVFGVVDLACDAVLFGLEEVEGDGVGVVGLEQLAAFGGELADASTLDLRVASVHNRAEWTMALTVSEAGIHDQAGNKLLPKEMFDLVAYSRVFHTKQAEVQRWNELGDIIQEMAWAQIPGLLARLTKIAMAQRRVILEAFDENALDTSENPGAPASS